MRSHPRRRFYEILNVADYSDVPSRVFDIFLISLILLNVAAIILASVDRINGHYDRIFELIRDVSITLFILEYGARIWCVPEHPSRLYKKPVLGRLRYIFTPMMVTDFLAILPFLLGLPRSIDLRILRLFRLLSILRITHHSPALGILASVLKREIKSLVSVSVLMIVLLIIASTIVYYFEREVQPEAFASIPRAMWWGMATLTTVGYGDVVPHTVAGKGFGIVVMFIGIGMFAVPTGIIVSTFAQEIKRKDFIVTWNLVAHVPYFSRLDALEIARISELLRVSTAMHGEVIFHEGDIADSIYFVVSGDVEIATRPEPVYLSSGDFFGELSLINKSPRTATVIARSYVELLRLDVKDLETLLKSNPELWERITAQAEAIKSKLE